MHLPLHATLAIVSYTCMACFFCVPNSYYSGTQNRFIYIFIS